MRRLLPLALCALTGCYPYLSEDWYTYLEAPEETQLMGRASVTDPAGGYWEDGGAAYGVVLWGWLEEPENGLGATEALYGSEGCQQAPSLDHDFVETTDSTSTIAGPAGALSVTFDDDIGLFYAELDNDELPVVPDSAPAYSLEEVEVIRGGLIEIAPFFTVPAPLDFDGPDMSTTDIPQVAADEMTWTWSTDNLVPGTEVVAELYAVNSDFEVQEYVTCLADARSGEITVDEDVWDRPGRHAGWYVRLRTISETNAPIPGPGTGSSMSGEYVRLGFFFKE